MPKEKSLSTYTEYLEEKYGANLSRQNIAEELSVSRQTIRRAERRGKLKALKLGFRCIRYPAASVAEYVVGSFDNLT